MPSVPLESGSKEKVKVSDRQKRIKESIAQCEDVFGDGAVMQLGNKPPKQTASISTGSLKLDMLLGCGGFPKSYMVEIYGPEGGGKTTLCLQGVASAQREGGHALYIDTENKLNLHYAMALGVNVKELLVSQPDYGEAAFQIAETFIKNQAVDIIVVDSVAALLPKAEFEGEIGDAGVGLLARLMAQALRKLKDQVRKSSVAMVFINQLRDKIGINMPGAETTGTPGGRALKHHASVRIDVRRIQQLKNGDEIVGHVMRTKVVKNTFAPPFHEATSDLLYGLGVSREAELIDMGTDLKVLEKSGASYTFNGERLGHGRENARLFLKEHPDIFQSIYAKVKPMMFKGT